MTVSARRGCLRPPYPLSPGHPAVHSHSQRPVLFPKPEPNLSPNTCAFESQPMVKPTGFREYDARWLFEKEINLMGAQALGLGLARLL